MNVPPPEHHEEPVSSDLRGEIMLLRERHHDMLVRLERMEKQQNDVTKLLNRGIGGVGVIMGLGMLVGWIMSITGNALRFFK